MGAVNDGGGYYNEFAWLHLKWPHWPNDKDVGFTEACVFEANDDEYLNANKSYAAAAACINEY